MLMQCTEKEKTVLPHKSVATNELTKKTEEVSSRIPCHQSAEALSVDSTAFNSNFLSWSRDAYSFKSLSLPHLDLNLHHIMAQTLDTLNFSNRINQCHECWRLVSAIGFLCHVLVRKRTIEFRQVVFFTGKHKTIVASLFFYFRKNYVFRKWICC